MPGGRTACEARRVSFSRRNPDDPEPKPWNWWLLGGSIAAGLAAFALTFSLPTELAAGAETGEVVTTSAIVQMVAFMVLVAVCITLGYRAARTRNRYRR